jgi:hypothetical protein
VVAGVLAALPLVTLAQNSGAGVFNILNLFSRIVSALIPIVIGIAVLMFLWGVLKYVTAGDEDGQKEARTTMISGIVVLFVMVSIWGLVNILGDTLSLNKTAPPPPQIPGFRSN